MHEAYKSILKFAVSGEVPSTLSMPDQDAASSIIGAGSKRSKGSKGSKRSKGSNGSKGSKGSKGSNDRKGASGDTHSSTTSFMQVVSQIADHPTSEDQPDVKIFFKAFKKNSLVTKFVYVFTVVTIVFLSNSVLTNQWLLPYYFTIATPILLLVRLYTYWKLKWQYFMLDFCYFSNIFWYVLLWAYPGNSDLLAIGFSLANGPLVWALFIFRNSLVFHSLDKVTSVYIHTLPSLLAFVVRWYPENTGLYWIGKFSSDHVGYSPIYLIGYPLLGSILHAILSWILVRVILRPSEEHLTLFTYLMGRKYSIIGRICSAFGPKFQYISYSMVTIVFSGVTYSMSLIWYNNFVPHCIFLVVFYLIATFNGATYYIDVFRLKHFTPRQSPLSKKRSIDLPVHSNEPK